MPIFHLQTSQKIFKSPACAHAIFDGLNDEKKFFKMSFRAVCLLKRLTEKHQ